MESAGVVTADQGWEALTPLEYELAAYGRSVLAAHFDASEYGAVALPDDEAVYVYPCVRGGGVLFVAKDRSVLFKGSTRRWRPLAPVTARRSATPDRVREHLFAGRRHPSIVRCPV